jgi:hypothetical protein
MSTKWRSAALAAVMTVSGAVAASPAGAEIRTVGDPTGDVPYCQGDITTWSVDYEDESIRFSMTAACGSNAHNDPHWTMGETVAAWAVDVGSNNTLDYVVAFGNPGTGITAPVMDLSGKLVCSGSGGYDGKATFTARVPTSCIPGNSISVAAAFGWDENPGQATCTCPVDESPDGGATFVGPIARASAHRQGYWMVTAQGVVYGFGDARHYGNSPRGDVVDIEPSPGGRGYWFVIKDGTISGGGSVRTFGVAPLPPLRKGEEITAISGTKSGNGVWLFSNQGRVFPYGDAPFLGDMSGTKLNGPVLDSIVTPSGNGYYMVASDGGIFTFGDAAFYGSMGATKLNKPVQSLVPDTYGTGYWLVASDGGIFAFEAPFYGSMGDTPLAKPVTGMVGFGNGYLMVGEDGGIFTFGDAPFFGSLGDNPPAVPIVSVAVLNT